jgi:hypothetical protein
MVAAKGAQVRLRWQVGEIVFLLSRHPVFADEPSLVELPANGQKAA